jgi:hypothetical protein
VCICLCVCVGGHVGTCATPTLAEPHQAGSVEGSGLCVNLSPTCDAWWQLLCMRGVAAFLLLSALLLN